ncbi:hypothetical protein E4U10_006285 [Claviceps purpurea]|nr:hypothetical protein E4U10_006285 [Claviceps purpurea]
MIITSEQQDLEGGLQNLSLNPGPSTAQPGPSEGAPNLEDLHPSLEHLEGLSPTRCHTRLRDQFCDDFYGWTTTIWENASKPIRSYARDYLLDNGVTLDSNVRKIGDKLVALVQQNHEALTTRYSESLKRSDSQLDLNHPANRSASPMSYHKATHTAARRPASTPQPMIQSKREPQQTQLSQSPSPALNLVITGPPHRRREAAALPGKDWRSDDLATNEDPLTNTDHLLDEEIANPRGEGSDFTFEEPIRIDKKAPTVLRNGNDGTQPQKQERQKEKTLRGEFAPAY